jgi:primosomal protein N''
MKDKDTNSLLFRSMVCAVYAVGTLTELLDVYFEAAPDNPDLENLQELSSQAKSSIRVLAANLESHLNRSSTASKSIRVQQFKPTNSVKALANKLREHD